MIGGASKTASMQLTGAPPPYLDGAEMTETKKSVGRIIKVSKEGWGFISSRDIEFTRIFFHWTSLVQNTLKFPEIKTGMWAEFTPMQVPGKGWRAIHVRIIEKEKSSEQSESTEVPAL